MGDHSASIKLKMTIHGHTYRQEMWINYVADEFLESCDRVAEWFGRCWTEAKARYDERMYESNRAAIEDEEERRDRAEYERLTAKYDHSTTGASTDSTRASTEPSA